MRNIGFVKLLIFSMIMSSNSLAETKTWMKQTIKIECPMDEFYEETFTLEGQRLRKGWSFKGQLEGNSTHERFEIETEMVSLEIFPDTERVKELEFTGKTSTNWKYKIYFEGSNDGQELTLLTIHNRRTPRQLLCEEVL